MGTCHIGGARHDTALAAVRHHRGVTLAGDAVGRSLVRTARLLALPVTAQAHVPLFAPTAAPGIADPPDSVAEQAAEREQGKEKRGEGKEFSVSSRVI